jgi:hypothetical protein
MIVDKQIRVDSWHLDKKFALFIVGAVLTNAGSGIWYAAQINSTIQQDHANIQSLSSWREKQDDERSKIDSHLAVVDEKLTEQNESLKHIIEILEKPQRVR